MSCRQQPRLPILEVSTSPRQYGLFENMSTIAIQGNFPEIGDAIWCDDFLDIRG